MNLVPRTNSGKLLLTGVVWLGISVGANGYFLDKRVNPALPYTIADVRSIGRTLTESEKHTVSVDSIAQQTLLEYEDKRPFLGLVGQLGLLAVAYGAAGLASQYVVRKNSKPEGNQDTK